MTGKLRKITKRGLVPNKLDDGYSLFEISRL